MAQPFELPKLSILWVPRSSRKLRRAGTGLPTVNGFARRTKRAGSNLYYRRRRTRPCQKRKDGSPTVLNQRQKRDKCRAQAAGYLSPTRYKASTSFQFADLCPFQLETPVLTILMTARWLVRSAMVFAAAVAPTYRKWLFVMRPMISK